MITFSFTYTPEDLRALRAELSWLGRRRDRIVIFCSGPLLLGAGVYFFFQGRPLIAAGLALLGLFQLLWWPLFTWLAKRSHKQVPLLNDSVEVTISDESIHATSDKAESTVGWAAFSRVNETEDLFMLYSGKALALYFPKRAFTPDEILQFRDLASRKIQT